MHNVSLMHLGIFNPSSKNQNTEKNEEKKSSRLHIWQPFHVWWEVLDVSALLTIPNALNYESSSTFSRFHRNICSDNSFAFLFYKALEIYFKRHGCRKYDSASKLTHIFSFWDYKVSVSDSWQLFSTFNEGQHSCAIYLSQEKLFIPLSMVLLVLSNWKVFISCFLGVCPTPQCLMRSIVEHRYLNYDSLVDGSESH